MGTRNLTIVYHEGKYKLAQYCQWDGYPSGQGIDVLRFTAKMVGLKVNRDTFLQNLDKCHEATEDEFGRYWKEITGKELTRFVSFEASKKFAAVHPQLDRDLGAKVLELITSSSNGLPLQNAIDFAANSLSCEWAYVLDFDKNTFEVYKGFNTTPLNEGERFASLKQVKYDTYYPIKLLKKWALTALPSEEEFLKLTGNEEEEEI